MDKITTLHPKGDLNTNVYPNIVTDNIPNEAVTRDKIASRAVGDNEIEDGAITADKLDFGIYLHSILISDEANEGELQFTFNIISDSPFSMGVSSVQTYIGSSKLGGVGFIDTSVAGFNNPLLQISFNGSNFVYETFNDEVVGTSPTIVDNVKEII